jgi:hypothetical protein
MKLTIRVLIVLASSVLPILPAHAQDQPDQTLMLSVTNAVASTDSRGTRSFVVFEGERLEPRTGGGLSIGRVMTLVSTDITADPSPAFRSRQVEWLMNVVRPSAGSFSLAAGSGVRHEAGGADVLLGRVVAQKVSERGRLEGNLLLEHPLATHRDAVDLITTVGWARRVSARASVGVEGFAEDLESLWSPAEAEGGARIFVGPTVQFISGAPAWTVRTTVGADVHPALDVNRPSSAYRIGGTRTGWALRVSMTHGF